MGNDTFGGEDGEDAPADDLSEEESLTSNNPIGIPEGEDHNPVAGAITRRIIHQHPELLAKYGPHVVMLAIDEIADFVGDTDEIGSSDVSGWVKQLEQSLGRFAPVKEGEVDESALQAYLGNKKYGKDGMRKLQQLGREHASKATVAKAKAEYTSEDLDADQKRVGQLGPTSKVKNNNIGKLVGANENFIGMAPQAVAEGQEDLDAIKRLLGK
jgi:hypothetical protein